MLFTFVVLSPFFIKVKTRNEAVLMCAVSHVLIVWILISVSFTDVDLDLTDTDLTD